MEPAAKAANAFAMAAFLFPADFRIGFSFPDKHLLSSWASARYREQQYNSV
jgi:hypothetical protein